MFTPNSFFFYFLGELNPPTPSFYKYWMLLTSLNLDIGDLKRYSRTFRRQNVLEAAVSLLCIE